MGMFDYVVPECALPDEVAAQVGEWQTKTFDAPALDIYRITADGLLLVERVRFEDRSDPNAEPGSLASLRGMMTPVHDGWDETGFDGVLNFYGSTDPSDEWVEYDATFVAGAMTSIVRIGESRAALSGEGGGDA